MTGFVDRFGGSGLTPSDVAWAAYTLSGNFATYWPAFANPTNVLARQMDITPTSPGWQLALPDATLGSPGRNTVFRNTGVNSFIVTNFAGATIYTLTPGQVINIYLTDNTTQAGQWGAFIIGAGVASLDLANAAGNGLFVSGSKLTVAPISSATSGNRTIGATDCATSFVWTGGAGTFVLPLSTQIGQFFMEVRNQGSGALTLLTSGGELIDSSASDVLQIGESCMVHAGAGFWYTVGRGRAANFAFTQLQKTVTGGVTTLSLTEAANVVQTYTGTLTSNESVVVPAVVQVYYVSNQTSGAFNFLIKAPGAGTTVSIPTGQNAVLFCDGTNVINASTTIAGLASLILGSGSASSPPLGLGASNTGLFSSGTALVSVASNAAKVADFGPTGLTVTAPSGVLAVNTPSGNASLNLIRPASAYALTNLYTVGNLRWAYGVDNSTETGSNNGSNYVHNAYNDGGAFSYTAFSINRASGVVNFPQGLTGTLTGTLVGNASTATSATNATNAQNATTATTATQLTGGYVPGSFMIRASGNAFTCSWTGSRIIFGVDGNYFSNVMPIDISGNAATCTTATNSTAINNISGWSYTNAGGNPVYVWATNGSPTSQFLCATSGLIVANSAQLSGQGPGYYINNAGTAAVNLRNNGSTFLVTAIGGFGDVTWAVQASDARLKKDVALTTEDSLAQIRQLGFVQFRFRNDVTETPIDDGHLHELGIIAQQAEKIKPAWVSQHSTWKQPDQNELLLSALHAIKQQAELIDKLTARVNALEGYP